MPRKPRKASLTGSGKPLAGMSVVIPTFKHPGQVSRSLLKILSSKGLGSDFSLEIILVDDSPDDKVRQAMDRVAARKKPGVTFRYRHPKKNVGIAGARNIGVSMAGNGIVIATDSDIMVEPDALLRTRRAFDEHPTASMVVGNVYWQGGAVDGRLDRPRPHDRRVTVGRTTYIEMMHGRYVAFRRKAFRTVGGYDADLFPAQGEGPDLSIRFWRAGFPIVYDKGVRVHHLSGFAKGERTESPYLYHGWNTRRTALMFRSILLYMHKYGIIDRPGSNWMRTIALESEKNFGDSAGYVILSSLATTLQWIAANRDKIARSRSKVPNRYDFKPYDVFTDRKLFSRCIRAAGRSGR